MPTERYKALQNMRAYCARYPHPEGRECSSCAGIANNVCTWWKDNLIPPKDFNYHCAGYEMDQFRMTNILIALEEKFIK